MNDIDLATLLSSLQNTMKVQAALLNKMEQRDAQMATTLDQQMRGLREQTQQIQRQVADIVEGAGLRIVQEAQAAVGPSTAEYNRSVATTFEKLRTANKTVQAWFATTGGTLLLVLLVGWAVLGYYRRELVAVKDELQRHENAIPVVHAFAASDAIVCDGRLCVNVDPNGKRQGDNRQYRPAKARQ